MRGTGVLIVVVLELCCDAACGGSLPPWPAAPGAGLPRLLGRRELGGGALLRRSLRLRGGADLPGDGQGGSAPRGEDQQEEETGLDAAATFTDAAECSTASDSDKEDISSTHAFHGEDQSSPDAPGDAGGDRQGDDVAVEGGDGQDLGQALAHAQELQAVKETSASAAATTTPLRGGFVSGLISRVFSIERHELRKFLTMSFMMFAIIYVFTMTRDTKDTLIVTNCGAEAIAFLKVYGVVPAAALFMLGYNWLSNRASSRQLFHMTIIPFFAFYAVFAFVMYPMRGALHHAGGALTKDDHPLAHLINLGRFWMFSLYYVVSELWGSAGVPLLFWTCANEVTPIAQAKRFYPLFALLGNLAPIASGQTMAFVSKRRDPSVSPDKAFESSLKLLSTVMLCAGASVVGLYEHVIHIRDKEVAQGRAGELKKAKSKPKMGLMESFRFLGRSRYLGCMALLVISYGLSMEFTEIIWKAIVKLAYPDKSDYMAFMGNYSTIVGGVTFALLLVGNKVVKYLGWEVGALATPAVMAVLAVPFFGYIAFGDIQHSRATLMLALYVGMVQNVLSKATKYAFFDPTKEMAYIPLDQESKVKGKAAIDVLGARLGKSGGALAQQGIVVVFGSILSGAPMLATMFGLVSVVWISSVLQLGKLFHSKSEEAEAADGA